MGQKVDKRKLDLQENPTSHLNFRGKKKKKENEQTLSHSSCSQMIDTTPALGCSYLLWEPDCIWDLPDIQGSARYPVTLWHKIHTERAQCSSIVLSTIVSPGIWSVQVWIREYKSSVSQLVEKNQEKTRNSFSLFFSKV